MKIYLAGPLFTKAELDFNSSLARDLRAAGHEVYLPQEAQWGATARQVSGRTRTHHIFENNRTALSRSEAVVAVCEGSQVDDGTAWEIGYAYGIGIPVYGLRTDSRITQQPDEKINLMVLESLEGLFESTKDLLPHLRSVTRG